MCVKKNEESRDSSVGIVSKLREIVVIFLAGTRNFSLFQRFETGSVAMPAPYTMGTVDTFPGCKVADAFA